MRKEKDSRQKSKIFFVLKLGEEMRLKLRGDAVSKTKVHLQDKIPDRGRNHVTWPSVSLGR